MPRVRDKRRAKKSGAYHHGDLRRALLDASLELIDKHGPEGFTLRAATRHAKVSDAAPYHHFADKEALLLAVAEEGFSLLLGHMQSAAGVGASAAERARSMGLAYVEFAARHPSHFRVMMSRVVLRQTRSIELARAAGAAFALVQQALLDGLGEHGVVRNVENVIFGSWALVHGLAFLTVEGHLGPMAAEPDKLRALVEGVMDVFTAPR